MTKSSVGKGGEGCLVWEWSLPTCRKGRGGLSGLGGVPFLPVGKKGGLSDLGGSLSYLGKMSSGCATDPILAESPVTAAERGGGKRSKR